MRKKKWCWYWSKGESEWRKEKKVCALVYVREILWEEKG